MTVLGGASGRSYTYPFTTEDLSKNLLDWLRAQGVTIASSCGGEGVCKKCSIQNDWLTCKLTLQEFMNLQPDGVVRVAYL